MSTLEEKHSSLLREIKIHQTSSSSSAELVHLKRTLNELQEEKLRLVDLLELEKHKLIELNRTFENQEIEIDFSEKLTLERQIEELKRKIQEKRSQKIYEEVIIEQEAPPRQEIVYKDIPQLQYVTTVVKPQMTYTATCDCGCQCHSTPKSYKHSVKKSFTSQMEEL